MEWKIKMDESEIDLLKQQSVDQAIKLKKAESVAKQIGEMRSNVNILTSKLSEAEGYISDLKMKRDGIKTLNAEQWELASSCISG